MNTELIKKTANTVRGLSIDTVQKANSGHPGLPLGMADVATVLFNNFLNFNPKNPNWFNRDRFVLSGGHGSALLYSMLHLYGYDLSLDDLKQFRQWHSKTPGHPELQDTPGVETTTGPLGQGIANAVGMALAENLIAAKYNTNTEIINHFTYVMAGDGDLQEGVSHEACSFAGHNKLGKLVLLYDSNDITIDGATKISFSEDIEKRFQSYDWHVQKIDGHNNEEIAQALKIAKENTDKPSIIICKTTIGFGSPNKAGTHDVHGSPLGAEEIILTKENLGISTKDFFVADEVYEFTKIKIAEGKGLENKWNELYKVYSSENEDAANELTSIINNELVNYEIPTFETGTKFATRASSGKVLDFIAPQIPNLIGGSADLTPSNKTKAKSQISYSSQNNSGQYIHYGIREFGMGAIMNGMALHGGLIPYSGTFFVFSDYMRSSIRMAALMGLRVIYVFTHDSIGLGEDGPTHQPIEHLSSLRAIPNMVNLRPMDANETAVAWDIALKRTDGPSSLVLTRQGLPTVDRSARAYADVSNAYKGGYIISEDAGADLILMASGSEVEIALKAQEILNKEGYEVNVVSFLSTEIFDKQTEEYKETVLPKKQRNRIAIEAAADMSWYKYVGLDGKVIGINTFGASAPIDVLYEKFNITVENVVNSAKEMLK